MDVDGRVPAVRSAGAGIPVVTPQEMGAIDAAAPEPTEVLIGRAGAATARAASALLGGTYGRRVVVVAGRGNNGADGRDAGRRLAAAGARVTVVEASDAPDVLPGAHLVIDAAYGTGFRGTWRAPLVGPLPAVAAAGARGQERPLVLAVDLPSGVDGLTGTVPDGTAVLDADATVTFAALKPGLLFGDGPAHAGLLTVADIGLDTSSAGIHLLDDVTAAQWLPERRRDSHKWRSAVWVVGGGPGMEGAVGLAAAGALRSGAGYVRCASPGVEARDVRGPHLPVEVVATSLAATDWAAAVLADAHRMGALVVGNGLEPGRPGDPDAVGREVLAVAIGAPCPVVLDAGALVAVAPLVGAASSPLFTDRVVLTPHDGEFATLTGRPPGDDRIADARALAASSGAVVLLKGPVTVVAHPDGAVLLAAAGDARLATAGTGDVLAGVIGALCARGVPPFRAAAVASHVHGSAAALGWPTGLTASDLPDLLGGAWEVLGGGRRSEAPEAAPFVRSDTC